LEDLDEVEVLENFKDLVKDLLQEKKQFKESEIEQLRTTNQQFESLIQKLEAESRNHVRTEQTLKVHIDGMATKIEELEARTSPKLQPTDLESGKTTVKNGKIETVIRLKQELENVRRASLPDVAQD
jgi:hypothetical protein